MRWSYPAVAIGIALIAGCKLITITIDESATTSVPAATPLEVLLGDFGFGEFVSMDLTQASELQNQNVAPGDIQDVRMESLSLEATSGSPDLSFLNSMDVYVEAPGLPTELLASASSFPEGQALVEFDIEDLDLTDYVVSTSMTFTTEVNGSRPEQATDVQAAFVVKVGVTSQGACNRGGGDE